MKSSKYWFVLCPPQSGTFLKSHWETETISGSLGSASRVSWNGQFTSQLQFVRCCAHFTDLTTISGWQSKRHGPNNHLLHVSWCCSLGVHFISLAQDTGRTNWRVDKPGSQQPTARSSVESFQSRRGKPNSITTRIKFQIPIPVPPHPALNLIHSWRLRKSIFHVIGYFIGALSCPRLLL